MINPKLLNAFPRGFINVCYCIWGEKASSCLSGAVDSMSCISNRSEILALDFMIRELKVRPFLNEKGLNSLIYEMPCCEDGPKVDFVGFDHYGNWLLLEAKSQIDSATIKRQPLDRKFEHSFRQLSCCYISAHTAPPKLSRAIVTACDGVKISSASKWSVTEGKVHRDGKKMTVANTGVVIEVVELPIR